MKIAYVNNTGLDLSMWHDYLKKGIIHEDLDDLITITSVIIDGDERFIINLVD